MQKKTTGKRRPTRYLVGQSIYLTLVFYIQNNLYNCAAACAFGFLFSVIPVIMMVLAVLVRFLHASPKLIDSILQFASQYRTMFDADSFINSILDYNSFGWVEFFLILFILWMARKFFATIMQGINRIFHTAAPPRPVFDQVIIFSGELVLVILAVIIILAVFAMRQVFTLPVFESLRQDLPGFLGYTSKIIISLASYFLIFIFVAISYRIAPGTKPPRRMCIISSAICTAFFFIISKITGLFLNVSNYNLIYGVLSSVMILLFEVYIFFTLFLICAQVIYVFQFFDSLLLGELYLLPEHDDTSALAIIRRVLFINPSALLDSNDVITCRAGETIYLKDDISDDAYYVVSGCVMLTRSDNFTYYDKGSFFGEESCILNKPRAGEARAYTDCRLMKVSSDSFRALLESDPKAAEKALSKVSEYVAKVYGRTTDFLV